MRRAWMIGCAVVSACTVADVDYTGKACPCPSGYYCKVDTSTCALGSAPPPPSPCANGIKDNGETGIDCGGACPRCPGDACAGDADCATGRCVAALCELATGPPSWVAVASLPQPRFDLAAAVVGERIYAIGGFDTLEQDTVFAYRPTPPPLGTWENAPPLATARRGHAAAADTHGNVYALGGKSANAGFFASVEMLGANASAWTPAPALDMARYGAAGALGGDGRIYAAGGSNDMRGPFNSVVHLAAGDAAWSNVATLATARVSAAAVAYGGLLYVCGGWDSMAAPFASCEAYSSPMDQWTSVASMPTPRMGLALAAGADQRLYAIGGAHDSSTANTMAVVEAFTPGADANAMGRWTAAAPLPKPAVFLAATTGQDGCVYAIGGIQAPTVNLADVVAYCPRVAVTPGTGRAGTTVSVSGSNFAADARVFVYLSAVSGPVASTTTDATGTFTAPATFSIPAACGASCAISVVDTRSRYPAAATFAVTP